ncbi:hypothetical protein N7488_008035 [Penicillium malachiteum]|nr:hypothetical protein N7488_008035 [Penicillium malachiteum]
MAPSFTHVMVWTLSLASLGLSAAIDKNTARDVTDNGKRPAGYTPHCNLFYKVQDGDTCWDIISQHQNTFTIEQLLCWNPDINPWCSNLISGRTYCVGVVNTGPQC